MVEAYLVGTLMSAIPYIFISFAVFVALLWAKKYFDVAPFKTLIIMLLLSIGWGGLQPSNTYKHEAKRLPNPVVMESPQEIKEIPPLIEQDKQERKERFEDLVNWQGRTKE